MIASALLGLGGIALVLLTTAVWFSRARLVAIPDNRLVFLLGWACGGLLGAAGLATPGANWLSGSFASLALIGGLFFLGLHALRKQKAESAISVGDVVPKFEAPDDEGRPYKSKALVGTPTLMKFFRGHW